MNILVTGSEGFIGKHLTQFLVDNGHTVEEFDVRNNGSKTVANYSVLHEAFERNEYVFHLAAVADVWADDQAKLFDSNLLGVSNIGKAAQETGTPVMFTSSITARRPTNEYAETKTIGEELLEYANAEVAWVRLSNVVGAGTQKGQVAAMIEQAVSDGHIEVWGNGEIQRTYVTVDYVCRSLNQFLHDSIGSSTSGFCGELGNVTMTNFEMAQLIAECVDGSVQVERVDTMPPSPKKLTVPNVDPEPVESAVRSQVERKVRNNVDS